MGRTSRIVVAAASGAWALVAASTLALAQHPADVSCKKTETQPECHARLKCAPSEDLEDCQNRLLACTAKDGLEDCQKRAGTKSRPEGASPPRDTEDHHDRQRDADQPRRERERDTDRGEHRERERDTDRGEHRDRDDSERRDRDQDKDRDRDDDRRRREDNDSDRRRGGVRHTKGFEANKKFGIGLELGEPAGLNGKYFVSKSGALDFGVGWIYRHYYYGDGFHIYGDYLWHPTSLVSASAFELPLYIGVGLRLWSFDYCDRNRCGLGGTAIGIRVPVGIAFDFNRVPLDIFIQLVPVLDFINGDYYDRFRDRTHLGVDLSAGLRYWFK